MTKHYYTIDELNPIPHRYNRIVFASIAVLSLFYIKACPTFNFEISYGPNTGPVFSIMSASLFLILYSSKVFAQLNPHDLISKVLAWSGLILTVTFLGLELMPSSGEKLFGVIFSSIPTLSTFLLFFIGELISIKFKRTHILYDSFLYLSLLPVELAFIGQLSEIPYLAGVFKYMTVGMSIPTQTFFGLFLLLNILTCPNLVTYQLLTKDKWASKVLFAFWFIWAATLFQYVFFLRYFKYAIDPAMQTGIYLSLMFCLLFPRVIFVYLINHLISVRFNLISMCAEKKKVLHNSSWIPVEKYLREKHRVSVSHSLCPEEIEKIKRSLSKI